MIGYLLYVTIPCMFQTLLYLDRGRSEFRVEREWGRKFQWGFRGKDRLFTALSDKIFLIPFDID